MTLFAQVFVSFCLLAGVVSAQPSNEVWLRSLRAADLEVEGARATPVSGPDTLLRVETGSQKNRFPSVLIHAPDGCWDLSAHRYLETSFRNIGATDLQVEFWAVGAPGWDAPVASVKLKPGETQVCAIDLQQRWKGGLVNKVDARDIRYLRVSLNKSKKGGRFEMAPVSLKGIASAVEKPAGYERLTLPEMVDAAPLAGRRVRDQLPHFEGTALYHSLYLPTDWQPGGRYPIIVEYAGNRWFSAPCHSIGYPEGSRMGYGMSEGRGFIWVNAPFVNADRQTQALNGWGDAEATVDYAVELVTYLCENFGGDHSSVILTGFSRGAVATGYIGRYNDRISDVWLAFHPCQHYDGDGIHGATYEGALNERGPRINGRVTFHTDNGNHEKLRAMFTQLGAPVIFASSELGAHTDTMFLENRPSTLALRKWLKETVAKKPGTVVVSGRVTDAGGRGVPGVRVASGETHVVYTDATGRYELAGLVPGRRSFVAEHGERSCVREVVLRAETRGHVDFVWKK